MKDGFVYWANIGTLEENDPRNVPNPDGSVMRVSINGGPQTAIATGLRWPQQIAVDAMSVYWTTLDGNVSKAPIGGGPAVTIASGQAASGAIAVDAKNVYWGTQFTETIEYGAIMRADLATGTISTLASKQSIPCQFSPTATMSTGPILAAVARTISAASSRSRCPSYCCGGAPASAFWRRMRAASA